MSTTAPSATTTTTVSTASSSALDSVAELRLIPEFGGKPSESVSEWLEKVDLVCNLRGLCKPETVIPLRLTDGAFAVYQQLSATDKSDLSKIKSALLTSFGVDAFTAYEQFVSRKIMPNESVDVYLSQLKLLSSHFGGASDKTLACAFVAGLPDEVKQLLRAIAYGDAHAHRNPRTSEGDFDQRLRPSRRCASYLSRSERVSCNDCFFKTLLRMSSAEPHGERLSSAAWRSWISKCCKLVDLISSQTNETLRTHCQTYVTSFGTKFTCSASDIVGNLVVIFINEVMYATPVMSVFEHD